jgi:hypothetical protein
MNTDPDDKESLEKPSSSVGAGVAIGMCIGVALGAALDNVGLGIALGLVQRMTSKGRTKNSGFTSHQLPHRAYGASTN